MNHLIWFNHSYIISLSLTTTPINYTLSLIYCASPLFLNRATNYSFSPSLSPSTTSLSLSCVCEKERGRLRVLLRANSWRAYQRVSNRAYWHSVHLLLSFFEKKTLHNVKIIYKKLLVRGGGHTANWSMLVSLCKTLMNNFPQLSQNQGMFDLKFCYLFILL